MSFYNPNNWYQDEMTRNLQEAQNTLRDMNGTLQNMNSTLRDMNGGYVAEIKSGDSGNLVVGHKMNGL